MHWSTYISPADGGEHVGVLHDGALHGLPDVARLLDLLGDDGQRLAEAAERARVDPFEIVPAGQVRFRAPIPVPPSIRDFMAFEEHVLNSSKAFGREVNPVWYDVPLFYFSNPAAVRGPYDPIPVSPGTARFDYELEIGAIVGRAGSDLDPATAEGHIAGYTVLADWSARDIQQHEMRGNLGPAKGKDSATSLSQWLITPDELAPYRTDGGYDLAMTAAVNGQEYSRGNAGAMYWSFGELLAYASRGTTVQPGDIIGSGTVGTGCILELSGLHGSEQYPWLQPGDSVRLDVAHVGTIETLIVAGPPLIPLR